MHKIFNYESKVMQAVLNLGYMILMNFLYLVCCIPVVTMGAAQAGLYSGMRHMNNEELDTWCIPAFFKGMKSGFKKITLVYAISLLPMAMIVGGFILSLLFDGAGRDMPVWLSGAAVLLFAAWQTMLAIFHASFECTAKELARNSFWAALSCPLPSFLSGVLLWLPAILLLMFPTLFVNLIPLFLFLYYSLAYQIIYTLMKKPLKKMKDAMFPAQEAEKAE